MTFDVIKGKSFELTPETITVFDWRATRLQDGWSVHAPLMHEILMEFSYLQLASRIEHSLDMRVREGTFVKVKMVIINPLTAIYLATEKTQDNLITTDHFREAVVHERSTGYFDLRPVQFGKYPLPVRVAKYPSLEYSPVVAMTANERGLPVGYMTGGLARKLY